VPLSWISSPIFSMGVTEPRGFCTFSIRLTENH
jgi:hypothetical protein